MRRPKGMILGIMLIVGLVLWFGGVALLVSLLRDPIVWLLLTAIAVLGAGVWINLHPDPLVSARHSAGKVVRCLWSRARLRPCAA